MRPVFIASIGNPGSEYAHTLHSAGHTLLAALVAHLNFPFLSQSRNLTGTKGRASYEDNQGIALWESPSYMNRSGPDLVTAWKRWSTSPSIQNFSGNTNNGPAESLTGNATAKALLPRLIAVSYTHLTLPTKRIV